MNGGLLDVGAGTVNASDVLNQNGGLIDLGIGSVDATTFVSDGAALETDVTDAGVGLISGDSVTISNTTWKINVSKTTKEAETLILAQAATNNLFTDITYDDIDTAPGVGAFWNLGISDVYTTNDAIVADYGQLTLANSIITVPGSEFDKALNDFSRLVAPGSPQYDYIAGLGQAGATYALDKTLVRTPEMANTLIRMQNVFASQIKDRTRSHLRYKNWGSNGSSAPQGAQGPEFWYEDTKLWLQEHLQKWNADKSMREVDEELPRINVKGDPSDVSKPYMSSSTKEASSEYNAFVQWLNELLPKPSLEEIEVPTTYQVWGRGYASRIDQDSSSNHEGYDATIGGGTVGLDKRFNNLLIGLGGGYAYTSLDGKGKGNDGTADTIYGTLYSAINGEKGYLDANVNYAINDVDTEGVNGMGYTGSYDASTFSMYIGGGLGFSTLDDTLLFSPEASLLTTYYDRESYTESSRLGMPSKKWDSYDQWSYLSSVGATLSMIKQIESFNLEMEFQPEIRAHWLHEFNHDMDDESYRMLSSVNDINVALQSREEDLLQLGTGVRFSKWHSDEFEFGLDVDGVFGEDYIGYMISGKLMHRF
jgi:outer membrane autotransporter protein